MKQIPFSIELKDNKVYLYGELLLIQTFYIAEDLKINKQGQEDKSGSYIQDIISPDKLEKFNKEMALIDNAETILINNRVVNNYPIKSYEKLAQKINKSREELKSVTNNFNLDNLYPIQNDEYTNIHFSPPLTMPVVLCIALKLEMNKILQSSLNSELPKAQKSFDSAKLKIEQKMKSLKECNDNEFIEKELAPLQKNLDKYNDKISELKKEIINPEEILNKFLKDNNLTETYNNLYSDRPKVKKSI